MPMTDDEQREIFSRIRSLIIDDFHGEFQEIYSHAVTVLELVPEQSNNEVRNAMNHIARSLNAPDYAVAKENYDKACGHIERAKRDCVKLAIIHLHEQITSDLVNIEIVEGAVPFSLKQRLSSLEEKGYQARLSENAGDVETFEKFAEIFAEFKQFRSDVHKQYAVPSGKRAAWRWWFRRIQYNVALIALSFSLGIGSGVVGNWIYNKIFLHPHVHAIEK